MFPRDRVISSLTKYEIAFEESESDDALRTKLAEFYARRTLTHAPITPADQAEAAYFLLSDAASKTTGQIIHVDGGYGRRATSLRNREPSSSPTPQRRSGPFDRDDVQPFDPAVGRSVQRRGRV